MYSFYSTRLNAVRSLLFVAAIALTALPAIASSEAHFDRTLTVSGPVTLNISTGSGDIHVTPGDTNTVVVHARVRANGGWFSGSGADDRIKQIVDNPPIEQSGNAITIGKKQDWHWGNNISIDYEVTTPRQTSLTASTGSGDVRANGLNGDFKANSGSGDLNIDEMTGYGNVSTGSGNIRVKDLSGAAKLDTGSGDVELSQSTRADAQARTGSGNIHINNAQGGVRAHTGSGDLEVSGTPNAEWHLETGSGSVNVSPTSGSKFTLNASSGSGGIHSDQPLTMQGALDKHHVQGTVNGGGPTVYVETGSGGVHIH